MRPATNNGLRWGWWMTGNRAQTTSRVSFEHQVCCRILFFISKFFYSIDNLYLCRLCWRRWNNMQRWLTILIPALTHHCPLPRSKSETEGFFLSPLAPSLRPRHKSPSLPPLSLKTYRHACPHTSPMHHCLLLCSKCEMEGNFLSLYAHRRSKCETEAFSSLYPPLFFFSFFTSFFIWICT